MNSNREKLLVGKTWNCKEDNNISNDIEEQRSHPKINGNGAENSLDLKISSFKNVKSPDDTANLLTIDQGEIIILEEINCKSHNVKKMESTSSDDFNLKLSTDSSDEDKEVFFNNNTKNTLMFPSNKNTDTIDDDLIILASDSDDQRELVSAKNYKEQQNTNDELKNAIRKELLNSPAKIQSERILHFENNQLQAEQTYTRIPDDKIQVIKDVINQKPIMSMMSPKDVDNAIVNVFQNLKNLSSLQNEIRTDLIVNDEVLRTKEKTKKKRNSWDNSLLMNSHKHNSESNLADLFNKQKKPKRLSNSYKDDFIEDSSYKAKKSRSRKNSICNQDSTFAINSSQSSTYSSSGISISSSSSKIIENDEKIYKLQPIVKLSRLSPQEIKKFSFSRGKVLPSTPPPDAFPHSFDEDSNELWDSSDRKRKKSLSPNETLKTNVEIEVQKNNSEFLNSLSEEKNNEIEMVNLNKYKNSSIILNKNDQEDISIDLNKNKTNNLNSFDMNKNDNREIEQFTDAIKIQKPDHNKSTLTKSNKPTNKIIVSPNIFKSNAVGNNNSNNKDTLSVANKCLDTNLSTKPKKHDLQSAKIDKIESVKKKLKTHQITDTDKVINKTNQNTESVVNSSNKSSTKTLIKKDESSIQNNKKSLVKTNCAPLKIHLPETHKAKQSSFDEANINISNEYSFKIPRINEKSNTNAPESNISTTSDATLNSNLIAKPNTNLNKIQNSTIKNSSTNTNQSSISKNITTSSSLSLSSDTTELEFTNLTSNTEPNRIKKKNLNKTNPTSTNTASSTSILDQFKNSKLKNSEKLSTIGTYKTKTKQINFDVITFATLMEQYFSYNLNLKNKDPFLSPLFLINNYVNQMSKIQSLDFKYLCENLTKEDPIINSQHLSIENKLELYRLMSGDAGRLNSFIMFSLVPNISKKTVLFSADENQIENSNDNKKLNVFFNLPIMKSFGFYCSYKEKTNTPFRMGEQVWSSKYGKYDFRITFENDGLVESDDPSIESCVQYIMHRKNSTNFIVILKSINSNLTTKPILNEHCQSEQKSVGKPQNEIKKIQRIKETINSDEFFQALFCKKVEQRCSHDRDNESLKEILHRNMSINTSSLKRKHLTEQNANFSFKRHANNINNNIGRFSNIEKLCPSTDGKKNDVDLLPESEYHKFLNSLINKKTIEKDVNSLFDMNNFF